jgi:hypothetical protein
MKSEERIMTFLSKYEFSVERFTQQEMRNRKTPDYRVTRSGKLFGFCEVKDTEKDKWLYNCLINAKQGENAGGLRQDLIFNRLTAHIHNAKKQFNAVNPNGTYPNILVFYNEDEQSGFDDLLSVTTGNFYAEGEAAFPIYRNYSVSKVNKDIESIHLFLWLDDRNLDHFLFNIINPIFLNELCSVFEYDPKLLKIVH